MCITFSILSGLVAVLCGSGLFFLVSDVSDMHTFNTVVTASTLPMPPTSFPEALRGMMWMDQLGHYAHSDIPIGAPDFAFSLADTPGALFDPKTRSITVDVAGPAWQWMNRLDGKVFFKVLKAVGFRYVMQFNEDYSFTQIYPTLFWGLVSVPKQLLSFTMVKQTPPADACPPAKDATKAEISKCAAWDRVSTGLLSPLFGSYGVLHYYVFQIIDGQGQPVQPYYDVFQEYAKISAGSDSFVGKTSAQGGQSEL